MADEGFKRKLTAILSADLKDYSRLREDDEAETVRTLNAYRTVISDLIQILPITWHRLQSGGAFEKGGLQ